MLFAYTVKEPAVSVLEELKNLEEQVTARMKQLRPLVAEYTELQQAAKRLGLQVDAATATAAGETTAPTRKRRTSRSGVSKATSTASTTSAGSSKSGARSRRKPGSSRAGNRAEQVAQLVRQRPGITVKELGTELGVDPTSLYRVVKRLQSEGTVTKTGAQLQPK